MIPLPSSIEGATVAPARPILGILRRSLLAALLAASLALPAAAVQAQDTGSAPAAMPSERERVAAQLGNVKRLLQRSSGAQRVLASDDVLARNIREDALGRYAAAETAFAAGDYPAARQALTEAAQSMFQAVRMLGPAAEVVQRKATDFEARVESTRALLQALTRIAAEEGAQGAAAKTAAGVDKAIAAARALLAQGRHDDARKLLDGGYEMAKAAVEGLRDGKTLVRSLTFDSPQAEYRYELDRNDTHQMLVRVVVQEKSPGAQASASVERFVEQAVVLRRQAEQQASGGDYGGAIRLLEQSTKELVRAIRSAGLYIPG